MLTSSLSSRAPVGAAALLALTLLGVLRADDARACAPAMPEGAMVRIAAEEALIVWDAEHRTEHFIRRADFDTEAPDFGFLVPTPSPPRLTAVRDSVFENLRLETAPEEVTETDWTVVSCCTTPFLLTAGAGPDTAALAAAGVRVLSEQRVAGLDATVLAADDAEALGAWLGEHGYENRAALVAWLAPYVRDGFAVTAFRYEKREGETGLGSQSVRMSFETDRPFYPFREPSDQPASYGRSLRVWLVGPERMNADGWNARPEYAAPVHPSVVSGAAPEGAVADGAWLSSFFDGSATRSGAEDAFFERVDQTELHPPPIVHHRDQVVPAPVEPVIALLLGIWFWRRRRAKADAAA